MHEGVDHACGEGVACADGVDDLYAVACVAVGSGAIGEEAAVRPEGDGHEAALRGEAEKDVGCALGCVGEMGSIGMGQTGG